MLANRIGGNSAVLVPLISRIVPGLALGSLAGVVADRYDRKFLMVFSDMGRGVVVLLFLFAQNLVMIAVISALLEVLTMIRQPAREAAVPTLVPKKKLVQANSLSLAAAYGTAPLGAAAWSGLAALFAVLGALGPIDRGPDLAFAVDSITFFASGVLVMTIPVPKPKLAGRAPAAPAAPAGFDWRQPLRDLVDGFSFVVRTGSVRRVVLGMAVALFGGGALLPLGQSFARDVLAAGETGFGFLVTALGAGVGVGMLGVALFGARGSRHDLAYALGLCVTGMAVGFMAFAETIWGASGWSIVAGAGTGFAYVMGFTHLHHIVDDTLRGRTFAALFTLVRSAMLVSFTVAVLVASGLDGRFPAPFDNGIRNVFVIAGGLIVITGAISVLSIRSGLRPALSAEMRESLEDASHALGGVKGKRKESR